MGIAVFIFLFFDFIIIILIISIMKLFAFRILGVAMLIVCTSAAPLSEERRGENVFKCDTDGYMSSGGHKLKCGRGLESGPYEMQRSSGIQQAKSSAMSWTELLANSEEKT